MKPIIEVRHYGGDQPIVKVPAGLDIEIKIIDMQEVETKLLEYAGLCLYWTVYDCDMISDYWVAMHSGVNSDSEDAFDLRDLPECPPEAFQKYALPEWLNHPNLSDIRNLAWAIDQGLIDEGGLTEKAESK